MLPVFPGLTGPGRVNRRGQLSQLSVNCPSLRTKAGKG